MLNKEIRVLHIMSGFGGGISSFIRNKADYIPDNIIFDVATYDECDDNFKNSIEKTGGEIYKILNPKISGWKEFKESFLYILKNNHYDIIYCHINGYRILPYYYYVSRNSDAKFYVHAHLSKPIKYLNITEKVLLKVDQIINKKTSEQIVGCGELAIQSVFGNNISRSKIMVVPNSVEMDRFIKDNKTAKQLRLYHRDKYQLEDYELLIGHIGRLEKVKNHELTIQLAEYIKKNRLRMKILIIGEGNREVALKTKVNEKGLEEVITFTGRISPIEDFFPALDVMLLPSFAEGLPTVVVEAQASGVPVVMSNTITEEVDLGFKMLETVSLESDISQWVEAIEQVQIRPTPEAMTREQVIMGKKFSNEASAELYVDFLKGDIHNFTID